MLVLLAWLVGFDLWAHSPATVLGCLAVGVAGLLAPLWLIHWSPAAVRRQVGNYFDDQSTGAVIRRVQDSTAEIDRFEREQVDGSRERTVQNGRESGWARVGKGVEIMRV